MTTPANLCAAKSTDDHRGNIPTELADHRALAERNGSTAGRHGSAHTPAPPPPNHA